MKSYSVFDPFLKTGNDAIHTLTKQQNQELLVQLEDFNGNKAHAKYYTFYIEDVHNKYRLHVSGYSGTAGEYRLHVSGYAGTAGEYRLHVSGYTGTAGEYRLHVSGYTGTAGEYRLHVSGYTGTAGEYRLHVSRYSGTADG
jgi:hypothetical protein